MAKQEKEKKEKVSFRQYTEEELKQFQTLIQRFYSDYVIETGKDKDKTIRVLNKKKLMVAYGAINEKDEVILTEIEEDFGFDSGYKQPLRLEEFDNLYDQWQKFKSRIDYGEKEKLLQFDEMSKQVADTFKIKEPELNWEANLKKRYSKVGGDNSLLTP